MDKKEIFLKLKKLLSPYGRFLKVIKSSENVYELFTAKKAVIGKKVFERMFFASIVIRGGFVGFYFFPVYTHKSRFKTLPVRLKKCLKGKSCFHIKELDMELERQIKDIVKKGFLLYKKAGWV